MDDQRTDRKGGVVFGCLIAAFIGVALTWLPYLCMEVFWLSLLRDNPENHMALSGPILYFLPILFWFAVSATGLVGAISAIIIYLRVPKKN